MTSGQMWFLQRTMINASVACKRSIEMGFVEMSAWYASIAANAGRRLLEDANKLLDDSKIIVDKYL